MVTAASLGLGPTGLCGMQEPAAAADEGGRIRAPRGPADLPGRGRRCRPVFRPGWAPGTAVPRWGPAQTSGSPHPSETHRGPGVSSTPAARGRWRRSFPSLPLTVSFPGAPRASCPRPTEAGSIPGPGPSPRAAVLERPGPQAQGQGGRRAALRSPNAHVRKWLHFSERKREVRLPRRGRHSSRRSLRAPFVSTAQSP